MRYDFKVNIEDGAEVNKGGFMSIPDKCPDCHQGVDVRYKYGYLFDGGTLAELIFQCPLDNCKHLFIGYYRTYREGSHDLELYKTAPSKFVGIEFSDEINNVSPSFETIYNQAAKAENARLDQICGAGYRRSIEFLIKDFVISILGEDQKAIENIKELFLGKVIKNHIDDENIKNTAKMAVWLGNDETHYYRRWEDKDINDLKLLIKLTANWIEIKELTKNYSEDMLNSNDK